MTQEDYCSYEIAKLLKEKKFDGLCYCHEFTDYEGNSTTYHTEYPENWNQSEPCVSIPTLGMAMKWLREVHNLCIAPYAAAYRYGFTIDKVDTGSNLGNEAKFYPDEEFETYEEAVEAALKYCLEKIIK